MPSMCCSAVTAATVIGGTDRDDYGIKTATDSMPRGNLGTSSATVSAAGRSPADHRRQATSNDGRTTAQRGASIGLRHNLIHHGDAS